MAFQGPECQGNTRAEKIRSSVEVSVMDVEQRELSILNIEKTTDLPVGGIEMMKTEPFKISRMLVYQVISIVKKNRGSAGVDELNFRGIGRR